jgi:hypothetical protein
MTPTSLLGGVLTGIIDGAVIMVLVFLGVYLAGKWRRPAPAVHPVAEDRTVRTTKTRIGELPPH